MRCILLLIYSLCMLGCVDTFTGELSIYAVFELTGEEDETVSLVPGTYPTKLRVNENRSMFEFELKDPSGRAEVLYLHVSKSIRIPQPTGSFSTGASGNGPAVDITGAVSADTSRTETVRDFELCTVQRSITDCAGPPPQVCRQVWRTYRGHQPVEYHFDQKIKRLTVDFIAAQQDRKIAAFHGETGQRWKIYTYRGPCLAAPP